ncbi:MAG: DUF11 domain-containing protein [Chloroflexi bacterium]|nr:DUF11 domain-containing protein [Chloroflexota bacterium]
MALNLAIITSMLIAPLMHSQRVSAFYETQNARQRQIQADRERRENEQAAVTELLGRDFDPLAEPGIREPESVDSIVNTPIQHPTAATAYTMTTSSDYDGDGLTDAVEVYELGTWYNDVDSDNDGISDRAEVLGFDLGGRTWYLDPRNPDSNGDTLIDRVECTARNDVYTSTIAITDTLGLGSCADTDGDQIPDVFDYDNDGDGVPDNADASPNASQAVANNEYFGLELTGIENGKSLFVDVQLRSVNEEHLWWTNNVLDWPANDKSGQIQRVFTNTLQNLDGDMLLSPVLEVSIPYSSTNPTRGLPITDTASAATITATTPVTTWVNLPLLKEYGLSVSQDVTGTVYLYAPLNVVEDEISKSPVAWGARLLYELDPIAGGWGNAHQMRLLWTVTALVDSCNAPAGQTYDTYCADLSHWHSEKQIIQTYPDDFVVTALSVQENHGLDAALFAQPPTAGGSSDYESRLWHLADTLQSVFLEAQTLSGNRFQVSDIASAYTSWGIPAGDLAVQEFTNLENKTELLKATNQTVVSDFFSNTVYSTSPAVGTIANALYVYEETYRSRSLGEVESVEDGGSYTLTYPVNFSNNTFTFDFTNALSDTVGSLGWKPHKYNGLTWEAGDVWAYMDQLGRNLRAASGPFTDAALEAMADGNASTNLERTRLGAAKLTLDFYLSGFTSASMMLAHGADLLGDQVLDNGAHQLPAEPVVDIVDRMTTDITHLYSQLNLDGLTIPTPRSYEAQAGGSWAKLSKSRAAILEAFGDVISGDTASGSSEALAALEYLGHTTERSGFLDSSAFVYAKASTVSSFNLKLDTITIGPGEYAMINLHARALLLTYYAVQAMRLNAINTAVLNAPSILAAVSSKSITTHFKLVKSFKGNGYLTIILAVVAAGISLGIMLGTGAIDRDSPAANFFYANLIASVIVAVIQAAIIIALAASGIGSVIFAVLAIVDAIIIAVCAIAGVEAGSDVDVWLCNGLTAGLARALAYVINDSTPLVDLDHSKRTTTVLGAPTYTQLTEVEGAVVGNQVTVSGTVTNTLYMDSPNWMGYIYSWQLADDYLDDATFDYQVQLSETDISPDLNNSTWTDYPNKDDERPGVDEGARFEGSTPFQGDYTFPKAGINYGLPIYLSEGYATQMQNCWLILAPVCWLAEFDHTNHQSLKTTFIFDVLPATLDGFRSLTQAAVTAKGETSYRLSWDNKFPTLADIDGDGLRSKAVNGNDPDDSTPDADGDGLNDYYEVKNKNLGFDPLKVDSDCDGLTDYWEAFYGTRPNVRDTDNDGLLDSEEVFHLNRANPYENSAWTNTTPTSCDIGLGQTKTYEGGWDIVYGFDGGAPLAFRVTSNPQDPDSDDDGLSDKQEQVYGYHPGVASSLKVLGLDSRIETNSNSYPYVAPTGALTYTANITNELTARYARGLLQAELPLDTVRHTLSTGVIPPQVSITMTGALSMSVTGIQTSQDLQMGIRAGAIIAEDTERVLWLHMNEPLNSTTFLDSSYHAHDAICTGNECPVADGHAVAFVDHQQSGQLVIPHHNDFDFDRFTIAFYVNPKGIRSVPQPLITREDATAVWDFGISIKGESMQLEYVIQKSNCLEYVRGTSTSSLEAGQWNHVALTYDGTEIAVYINGYQKGTTATTTALCKNSAPIVIGSQYDQYSIPAWLTFLGSIDEVEIYPQALTATTIQQRYGVPALQVDLQDSSTWSGAGITCPTARCPTVDVDGTHFDQKQHLEVNAVDLTGDAFTFAAWIKPLARTNPFALATSTYYSVTAPDKWNDADYQGVFGYKDPSDDKTLYPSLFVGSNGRLRFVMGDGTNSCAVSSQATGLITNDNWQHVAVTHDGTSTKFYVDGLEITGGTSGSCANVTPPSVQKFYIGRPNETGYVWLEKATFTKVFDKDSRGKTGELELRLNWWGDWDYGNIYGYQSSDLVAQGATINKFRTVETDGAKYFRLYEHDPCGWFTSCTDGGYDGKDDNLLHVTGITNISHLSNSSNSIYGTDGNELTDTRGYLYWDLSNDFFQGAVDDLQIYQYTLDADAVADLFKATATTLELDFDEPPGATVFDDTSGHSVSVTCSGDTCPTSGIAGRHNQALDFDGVDDFLTLSATGDDLGFNQGSLTAMMWVRPRFYGRDGNDRVSLLGDSTGSVLGWYRYGHLDMGSRGAGSIWNHYRWIHLAYVYEKTPGGSGEHSGRYRFFIDGVEQQHEAYEYVPIMYGWPPGAGDQLTIGKDGSGSPYSLHFNGLLDDFTIYRQALSPAQIQAAMNQAPVVNLHLDEDFTSGTFVDTTENRNHATCTGNQCPKPGDKGQIRESSVFSDSLLTVANSDAMPFPQFTVGLWVKPTDVINDWQPLITKQADNGDDRNFGLFISPNSMQVHYSIQQSNCATYISADSSGSLLEDQWNHVLMTYDGTQTALYINGALQGTQPYTGMPCLAANPIKIGGENSAFVPFSGALDEVVVYANALNSDEIADMYDYQAAWFDVLDRHDIIVDADTPTVDLGDIPDIISPHETVMVIGAKDATSLAAIIEYRIDGGLWATSTITGTESDLGVFAFPASAPGAHTVAARVTDMVGHVSEIMTVTVVVDGAPPALTITDQPAVQQITTELAVSGTVSDSVSGVDPASLYVTVRDHNGAALSENVLGSIAADKSWQAVQPFVAPPYGVYTITAVAADQAQEIANTSTTSSVVTLDGLGPYADVLTNVVYLNPVIPATFAGIVSDVPYPADSRQLHLHFEDGPGVFNDTSKNLLTLTCSQCPTTGVSGMHGDAATFDGNDYLDLQNNGMITATATEQLNLTNSSFTVLAWVKASDWNGDHAILGTVPITGLYLGIQNGSPILGYDGDDSVMTGTIPTDEWVHLAWRYDATTGERAFFVAGSKTSTATLGHAPYTSTATIQIGQARGGNGYSGALDELVVYAQPLDDEIIYDIANPLDVGIANMQARFRRFNGVVGQAEIVTQYGGDWTTATLASNSSNYTTWQVPMPSDPELGAYKLDLLVTDNVSNSTFVQGAWSGSMISPNLSITKTTPVTQTATNENITYTLTYTNVGAVAATAVVITETIPADTRFNAAASAAGWSCTPVAGTPGATCTYAVGDLLPGAGGVLSFALTVTDTLTPGTVAVVNTAEIDSDHGHINTTWSGWLGICISGGWVDCRYAVIPHYFDSDESDNTPSATASMYGAPDLQISQTDGGVTAEVMGGNFTYTLSYSNTGSQAAVVRLIETIPPYVQSTYEAYLAGWVCPDTHRGECTYDVGYVGINESGSVPFVAAMWTQMPDVPFLTNTVTISDVAGAGDLNYLDNTTTITTSWTFDFGAAPDNVVITVTEGNTVTNTGEFLYSGGGTGWWMETAVGTLDFDPEANNNWTWTYTSTDGLDETQVISITGMDDVMNFITTTFQLIVANVAPTIVITGANSATSGSSYSITLGSVVDPGTDTITTTNGCIVYWDDGGSSACYDNLGGVGSLTHVYTTPLVTRALTVALTDEDGTHTAAAKSVYVEAASATITVITTTVAVDEGTGLPEGYWSFENPGLPAADDSGNGHHGTPVNGASLTTTIPSTLTAASTYALDLDGTNDYVSIGGDDADFDLNVLSIAFWVQVDQFNRDWQAMVTKGDSAWRVHRCGSEITGTVAFGTSGLTNTDLCSNAGIDDGQWHHVAMVFDGSTKYIYIDGLLDNSIAAQGTIDQNNYSVLIGENAQMQGRYFDGQMDDVRIYGVALSTTEIRHVMRGGQPNVFMNGRYGPVNGSVSLSASEGSVIAHGDGTWTWGYDSSLGAEITRTVTITTTDGAITTTIAFTLTVTGDGVDGPVEDGAPNSGDGNSDGMPDRRQLNVTSIPLGGAGYATLAVTESLALRNVVHSTTPPGPLPAGTTSPLGFLNYQVTGVSANQQISVTMWLPESGAFNSYFQYGPTPDNDTPHWYKFLYDSTTDTGARLFADRIVLYFVDGQRGDYDLSVNGIIEDPGAIVYQLPDHELKTEIAGWGSVSPGSSYLSGTVVPVTATAGVGWTFTGWSGDLSGITATQTITLNSDQHIIANFTLNKYTLETHVVGLGNLAMSTLQDEYFHGDVVTMSVTPAIGWVFAGWSGDLSGTNATESLTMTANTAFTATFEAIPYTVNTSVIGGNGAISRAPDQASYIYDDIVMLTANPDPGYELSTWGGDVSGNDDQSAILVDGNKTVTAQFIPGVYTITLATEGDGQISVTPQQTSYAYEDVITLTAIADLGWSFDAWSGVPISNTVVQTMTMGSDVEILALFTQDQYRLNLSWEGAGDVSLMPNKGTYTYGEVVTATAVPTTNFEFVHWSGAVPSTTLTTTVTVTMTEERDLVAHFSQIPYTLTLNIVGSGGITLTANIIGVWTTATERTE